MLRWLLHQSRHIMLEPCVGLRLDHKILRRNSCPLDHRTTAPGTSTRCAFGSVTVSERVSPGRMGRSPERGQPVQERFHTVPWFWNKPALYVTEQCTGKRRKGRIEKGMGAHSRRGLRKPQGGAWGVVVLIGGSIPESCARGGDRLIVLVCLVVLVYLV